MTDLSGPREVALRMAEAAGVFLRALSDGQRSVAHWPFPSDDERRRWYYTPTDHGGLRSGDMRPALQQAALRLVATGVSPAAFNVISTIIGLENVLDAAEGWTARWGRERGRDPGHYYVRIFGDPGDTSPWSWRFGGHHVSLHHLIVGGEVRASTPFFLGADPATSPLLGGDVLRPLASTEDLGRRLARSLTDEQRRDAVISPVAPADLISANRPRLTGDDGALGLGQIWRDPSEAGTAADLEMRQREREATLGLRPEHLDALRLTRAPKGISAANLGTTQQELLQALLDVHLSRIPEGLAERELAKYEGAAITRLHFAWAGGFEDGQPHYYRVQGPRMLLEYDNAPRGANHVHSVWRDPEGDFGDDVLARHQDLERAAPRS